MARMSQSEIDLWNDRLDHAHMVWKDNGLTDDSRDLGAMALMNAYRTNTWGGDGWGGLQPEDLIEVPTVFSIINTQKAQMFAREPEVDVIATDPEAARGASIMEKLQNHLTRSRKLGMVREFNRTLDFALVLHFGVVRHGFTPSREVFDNKGNRLERYNAVRPDFPWIRSVPPWDIRIDPLAETFDPNGDARWCAFRTLHLLSEIRNSPGFINRDDLRPTRRLDVRLSRPNDLHDLMGEDNNELVEVWTFYDNEERKTFALSPGSSKPIRDPKDWPIQWESLPYNFLGFNPQLDTPFPIPPAMTIRHQAMERNKVRTLMAELVKRMRRIIALSTDRVNKDDLKKLTSMDGPALMEFVRVLGDNAAGALSEVRIGGLDQTLLLYDERLLEDAREAFGQSRMDRAQRINVETATEAAAVQSGAQLQRGRLMGPWEDFLSDVFATFGRALQSPGVLTDEFTIPILGQQNARELLAQREPSPFLTVTPESLQGEFIYQIRPGSTAPRDPDEEVRRAAADLQIATQFPQNVTIPQLLTDYFVARDKDPRRVLQSAQEIQATNALGAQQAGAEGGGNGQQAPPINAEIFRNQS